jgi:hypothetical protein
MGRPAGGRGAGGKGRSRDSRAGEGWVTAAHRGGNAGPFFTRGRECRRGRGDGVQGM